LAEKAVAQQRQVVLDLESLAKSIERCEKTILDLKTELDEVNRRHQNRKTTQEDIDYLTDLLKCAHKKLGWEKQLASLKKRTPAVLQNISTLVNDPKSPPGDEMRAAMLRALEGVQAAMGRLEKVKVD
jgi:chromosome segregation ATPase